MTTENTYDSRADTLAHIDRVQTLIQTAINNLSVRAVKHDLSKLEEPEKSTFDACTLKLKAIMEHRKGKKVVLVYPVDKWLLMLIAAGAQVRNLGDVRWCATEDGSQGKGTRRHIAAFILDGQNHTICHTQKSRRDAKASGAVRTIRRRANLPRCVRPRNGRGLSGLRQRCDVSAATSPRLRTSLIQSAWKSRSNKQSGILSPTFKMSHDL